MPRKKISHDEQAQASPPKRAASDVEPESAAAAPRDVQPEAAGGAEPHPPADFPIVGIGASAGGLAAFEAFFRQIPAETANGMAFVLVQHLAPDHTSILSELIRRFTHMPVFDVDDGMLIRRNSIYTIPPNTDLALFHGRLHLMELLAPKGIPLPIDHFFRPLAQEKGELDEVLPEHTPVCDYMVTHTFERIGPRVMRLNARELRQVNAQPRMILLAIDEITEHAA